MKLTKLESEMKLMLEAALGIWEHKPLTLPCEVLWKHLCRDLLRRVDSETLPRDWAGSHVPPAARSQDCPQVVAARDGDDRHNSAWIDPS